MMLPDDPEKRTTLRSAGAVRWSVTIFGSLVTAILLIMVVLSLSRWALEKFDRLVDPSSVVLRQSR